MKRISVPLEVKALSQEGELEGLGAVFGNVDFGNDVISEGAFAKSLADWAARKQLPLMPWFHDMSTPVGDWLEMGEDSVGLRVKGRVWTGDKQTNESKMVHNLMVGTGPKALSVGFIATKVSWGKQDDREVRFIEEAELLELSIVPFGMNPKALITSAKSLQDGVVPSKKDLERALKGLGMSARQAKALISEGYNGLERDAKSDERDAELSDAEEIELKLLLQSLNLS